MSQVKTKQQEALGMLEELLEQEFGDYSFKWQVEEDDQYGEDDKEFNYAVHYGMYDELKNWLYFRVTPEKKMIEINEYEDIYKQIEWFESSIKYFWIHVKWD